MSFLETDQYKTNTIGKKNKKFKELNNIRTILLLSISKVSKFL